MIQLTEIGEENRRLQSQFIRDARNAQIAQILLLPIVKGIPPASETLVFQIAMRNRHRTKQQGSQGYAHLVPSLCKWASQDSRLLLVSKRKDPKSPRYFATDVIEEVQGSPVPVIWALSKSGLYSIHTTLTSILRMLTVQALQIPRSPTEEFLISPAEIEMTTGDEEWLMLLKRALSGLKQVYIVIDTDVLKGSTSSKDQRRVVELMDKLLKQSRCDELNLKIIIIARRLADFPESPDAEEEPQVLRIYSDVLGKRNSRRQNSVRAAEDRASRYRAGCGRTKRFNGLAGLGLVHEAAPTADIRTQNLVPAGQC